MSAVTAVRAGRDKAVLLAMGFIAFDVLVWGAIPRVTGVAGDHTGPLPLTALRAAGGAFVLLLALPALRAHLPRTGAAWGWTALSGVLMVGGFLTGLTEAVILAGPGIAIVLSSTSPFFVALLERVFFGRRIPRLAFLGLLVGFAGVVLIVLKQIDVSGNAGDVAVGCACALGGALAWSIGTLVVTEQLRRDPNTDLVGLTAGQYVVGGLVLVIVSLVVDGTGSTDWGSGYLWIAVAYVAIIGSAIATIAYFMALRTLKPTRVTAWMFLTPVVAVIIEAILGNLPKPLVLLGMAVTVAGVGIVNATPVAADEPLPAPA
jgi:drug/metabolite transporter (DMT)-like permease